MDDRAWLELLEEFRALGGTAENVRLGAGPLGRGLFPVDPARPVALRVPANLLVAADDMVFEGGALRVGPNAAVGARERAFLDGYQERFGWGGGGEETHRQLEDIAKLPDGLRHELATRFQCGKRFGGATDALVRETYLGSRSIARGAATVVMPVIELVNHGEGISFDVEDGVGFGGIFQGEVLVRYSDTDPFDYFRIWGFAVARPVAFSIPMAGTVEDLRLRIGRDLRADASGPKPWMPNAVRGPGTIALDFLMLGNQQYPRLPKGIFRKALLDAGISQFEEPFDSVQHINRTHFLGLLAAVEDSDLMIARTLRTMARHQLGALSSYYGMRAV